MFSDSRMPSVGSEFCTVNETGAVGRQKNDDLSDFIRRISSELTAPFELALMFVCLDHVASLIVNANQSIA